MLLRIAARKAADMFRGRPRPSPGSRARPAASLHQQLPDDELWVQVRALPSKQRQAVGLRFVLDLDYATVGAIM